MGDIADEVDRALAGQSGPLVALALALAAHLDRGDLAAPAPVAKELRAVMADLAQQAAAEADDDDDEFYAEVRRLRPLD